MRNSFKDLEKIELEEVSMNTEAIKNGITSDIGIMKYVSEILDMFFPKIIDLFVGLAGSDKPESPSNGDKKKSKYPDIN